MSDSDTPATVVPRFESLVGQSGVHVHDPVEDVQAMFFTDRSVDPEPAPTDGFVYPVDSASEVTVSKLRTPYLLAIWIRDTDGNLVDEFEPNEGATSGPRGDYLLEFAGTGMKIYARITDTGFRIQPEENAIDIALDHETTLEIGARSLHSQPARTLKTTSDPTDLMRAVSLFGNAMKTWSPERTWPSLRGHPPLLELGTECHIPDKLNPPETDIEISVPAELDWLFPAAPLAYWLGATVTEGDPALHVDGRSYRLGGSDDAGIGRNRESFEQDVKDVLQFMFLLDCAVRTEGFYNVELDARRRVDAAGLPLDFEALYEAPLAERVREYLELEYSFEDLATRIGRPGWRLTADVQTDPERVTTLPFLARDLAVVRCPSMSKLDETSQDATEGMDDVFARSTSPFASSTSSGGLKTRSSFTPDPSSDSESRERIIGLPAADSMSQAWIGDGFAVGAAKASTKSYLQRLEKQAEGNSRINIDVVVNDEGMGDEASVSDIYGTRDHLAFDIDLHQGLSTEELANVFESETDFVHYIGHVDPEGFDCTDGYLNADQLGNVGADTFVLNACASYEQGQQLVDRGAIAGVVTLEDVINSLATKIGKTVARLLNYGFPIGSATSLVQETIFTGSNYVVVGDSNTALAQSNVAVPNVARIALRRDGQFDVSVETFASWNYDVGSMYGPYIEGCDCQYVVPGELDTWRVSDDELDTFLETATFPVVGSGNLYWSDAVSASLLRDQLQEYA